MDYFDKLCAQVAGVTGLDEMNALAVAEELDGRGLHADGSADERVILATAAKLGYTSDEG